MKFLTSLVLVSIFCYAVQAEDRHYSTGEVVESKEKAVTSFTLGDSRAKYVIEYPQSNAGHYLEITPQGSGMWMGTKEQTHDGIDMPCWTHWVDQADLIKETADFVSKPRGDSLPLIIKLDNKEIWRKSKPTLIVPACN